MSTTHDAFFESALALPSSDRADLAFQLLQSLELPGEEISSDEFGNELRSRVAAYRRGEIASYSIEEVRNMMEHRLSRPAQSSEP
ncbi:MAG: addiction module protein [Pirellulales bacterium]